MDETTSPPNPNASPLENALKQIQNWFVSGDFEKVKQGCEEILKIAPNNSIAQDLLAKTKGATGNEANPTGSPEQMPPTAGTAMNPPAQNAPLPETPPISSGIAQNPAAQNSNGNGTTPLSDEFAFQPPSTEWNTPNTSAAIPPFNPSFEHEVVPETHPKRSLMIQLSVLLGIFILGMGGIYGYKTLFTNTEISGSSNEDEEITPDNEENPIVTAPSIEDETEIAETGAEENEEEVLQDAESRNSKRLKDLKSIEKALISYYQLFKVYPATEEVNQALVENNLLEAMPLPPLEEEAYVYAVYDNDMGGNQIYILSATFENDNGEKEAWSTGGNALELTDYNDIEQPYVTILHPTLTEAEYLKKFAPKEEENTEEEPEKEHVPRV